MTDSTDNNLDQGAFDLSKLLPHRPPMLLLSQVIHVSDESAMAMTSINARSLFFVSDKGIPSWVGLEFMGQTAALIAGYQQQQGQLPPHTGFLLGSRAYKSTQAWFPPEQHYVVHCQQDALLGEQLASFRCVIHECEDEPPQDTTELTGTAVASALLTVYRQAQSASDAAAELNIASNREGNT